jgi:hypothetical protein
MVVEDPTCDLCRIFPEMTEHLIFQCPFTASFWLHLGSSIGHNSIGDLRSLGRPASLPIAHFDTFVLLCCWQLWKRRNGIVFCQDKRGAAGYPGAMQLLATNGAQFFISNVKPLENMCTTYKQSGHLRATAMNE